MQILLTAFLPLILFQSSVVSAFFKNMMGIAQVALHPTLARLGAARITASEVELTTYFFSEEFHSS